MRIVYAAPDYQPPAGIIALPLCEHPAIREDAADSVVTQKEAGGRTRTILPTRLVICVSEWLHEHTDGTVCEIAEAVGAHRHSIGKLLRENPQLFCPVGERTFFSAGCGRGGGGRWQSKTVWGVTDDADDFVSRETKIHRFRGDAP